MALQSSCDLGLLSVNPMDAMMLAARGGAARPACLTTALSPTSDVQKPPPLVLSLSPGPRCVSLGSHYKQIWLVSGWIRAHNPISEVFGARCILASRHLGVLER